MKLTEKQKEALISRLIEKINPPSDLVEEFINCYLSTGEAAEALLEHITQQTGLTYKEIFGEEESVPAPAEVKQSVRNNLTETATKAEDVRTRPKRNITE